MKVLLMLRIEISFFMAFTFFLYFDTSLSDLLSEAMHFYRNYIRIKKYALLIYYYLSTEFNLQKFMQVLEYFGVDYRHGFVLQNESINFRIISICSWTGVLKIRPLFCDLNNARG